MSTLVRMLGTLFRTMPRAVPGRARAARLALRLMGLSHRSAQLPHRDGLMLGVPALWESIALHLWIDGVYEPELLELACRLSEGGTFIDIGANIGSIALPVAKRGPGTRVIACEASPTIARLLARNVAENALGNVTVMDVGVTEQRGDAEFFDAPPTHFGVGTFAPVAGLATTRVRTERLDALLRDEALKAPVVLKLDVEGAEARVFAGGSDVISKFRPVVLFEFVDWAEARMPGLVPGDAQRRLAEMGYRIFRSSRNGLVSCDSLVTTGAADLVGLPAEAVDSLLARIRG